MKNVAIIMAGGKGERFWPVSKANMPKQFISLTNSNLTMIQLTVNRIKNIIDINDIYIVTNEAYKNIAFEQLPDIPKENIIFEPLSKNTAPCIALASAIIKKKYNDANVIVLASDHNIKNNNLFIDSIEIGIENLTSDNIITIGIIPTRIETGYGYIELGKRKNNTSVYNVNKFVEKPNYELAKQYYEAGNYLWNSGMFIWKNSFMIECIEKYVPDTYEKIKKVYDSIGQKNYEKILEREYENINSDSIDYAVMEKVSNILVIPGNFGWDDVGSWLSVERLRTSDENNNIISGEVISLKSSNNIIINNENDILLSTLGIDNTVVVNNKNCILIMNKDNVTDIKTIISKIKDEKKDKYL